MLRLRLQRHLAPATPKVGLLGLRLKPKGAKRHAQADDIEPALKKRRLGLGVDAVGRSQGVSVPAPIGRLKATKATGGHSAKAGCGSRLKQPPAKRRPGVAVSTRPPHNVLLGRRSLLRSPQSTHSSASSLAAPRKGKGKGNYRGAFKKAALGCLGGRIGAGTFASEPGWISKARTERIARSTLGDSQPDTDRDAVSAMLGQASETDAQHRRRHPQLNRKCGRCMFLALKDSLEQGYGSYKHEMHGGRRARTVWLAQRPSRLCGVWALGCQFCAAYAQGRADARSEQRREGVTSQGARRRGPNDANTKWSRYEVRCLSQLAARGVRQHAETLQHRLATRAYFMPAEQARTVLMSDTAASDAELFRGGVPQVPDWLRAWRACRTPVSFAAAQTNGITDNFIHGTRQPGPVSRRAFASMVEVMASVLRERKRAALEASSAISLALDDRKEYRVIRFKCDPASASGRSDAATTVSGCLGVLRRGGAPSRKRLSDADEDYSKAMADSVVKAVQRVCTTPGTGVIDDGAVLRICQKVRIGVADGAACAQKCLRILATGQMPNMLLVLRDTAHAVRIAVNGPLEAEERFRKWWDDVFGGRHALVLDIKNSEEWTEKLLMCQRQVLASQGVQGGGQDTVSRVLSFAKQRFDSYGTPQRQFCCLLVAIAMLLAYVASDRLRTTREVRYRAQRRLEELPHHVLTAGVSASYSDEAIRFIRLFDVDDHDPALSWGQKLDFERRMRALFLQGHIFADIPEGGDQTCLHIALDQARTAEPIYYADGRVAKLWSRPSKEESLQLADSMHAVTESMLKRVDAEISINSAGVLFCAFDLFRWHKALAAQRDDDDPGPLETLARQAKDLFHAWQLPGRRGVTELQSAMYKLRSMERQALDSNAPRDNRVVWAQALEPAFGAALMQGGFEVLPTLIRIYLAAMDGTCGVERDLGTVTRLLAAHSGPLDEDGKTIASLTDVLLDGPAAEDGLATRLADDDATLEPTEFTRACGRAWVDLNGRRFRCYRNRRKSGVVQKRASGSSAAVARKCRAAMDNLVKRAGESQASGSNGNELTVLGFRRRLFAQRSERAGRKNPAWGPELQKFDKLTQKKVAKNIALKQARRSRGNPYLLSALNPNQALRQGNVLTNQAASALGCSSVRAVASADVQVLCASALPLPPTMGYKIENATGVADRLVNGVRRAHMVVTDSVWELDSRHIAEGLLMRSFIIVALGKPVLCRRDWNGACPHQSRAIVHFLAAAKLQRATLLMHPQFAQTFPALCRVINLVVKLDGVLWRVVREPPAGVGEITRLSTLENVKAFLQKARRVGRDKMGLSGRYFT